MAAATLLDVNLLVALFDPDHLHHEAAHDWFADHHEAGWATCPVTENGFVRVLAHPAYGAAVSRPHALIERLRKFCTGPHHVFWGASVSLLDESIVRASSVAAHRQLTDIYLLALATKMGGRLATFDPTIPVAAVVGANADTLAVISPAALG